MKKYFALSFLAPALAVAVTLGLAACANTVPNRPVAHYTYKQYPPVLLNVARIQVVDYTPTMQAPHIEHLMPHPLPAAVSDWAETRFKAIGTDGTLIITVRDAHLAGKDLNRSGGVKGFFTIEQAERFDGTVVADFSVENDASGRSGHGVVKVNRGLTIAENASVHDRDIAWTTIGQDMITDLDAATMTMLQNRLSFLLTR